MMYHRITLSLLIAVFTLSGSACSLGDQATGPDGDGGGVDTSTEPNSDGGPCSPDLTWEGNYTVTDLASLENIDQYTTITGSLVIDPEFPQLTGPECLRRVDGDLTLQGNEVVETLDGFIRLEEVGGHVAIVWNGALTSVVFDTPLTSIGGGLYISQNTVCTQIAFPQSLEEINGDLIVEANRLLGTLAFPEPLSFVGGDVVIQFETYLTEIQFSGALTDVGGDFYIYNNHITELAAPGLKSVSGTLRIIDNVLPTCEAIELRDQLTEIGGACIYSNYPDECEDDLSGC